MTSRLFHTSRLAERLRTVFQHHYQVHSQMYVFNAGLHWDSCTDLQSAALLALCLQHAAKTQCVSPLLKVMLLLDLHVQRETESLPGLKKPLAGVTHTSPGKYQFAL